MSILLLDMLPMELLQSIGHILHGYHKPSVASFSLVNRQCRRAATAMLFRRLSIQVQSPESLATDVGQWTTVLVANDGFKHVRELEICGDIYYDWKRHSREQAPDVNGSLTAGFEYEKAWLPMVRFMDRVPALKDLFYRCGTSFPSCLLAVLHKDTVPLCRLHISHFILKSLKRNVSEIIAGPLELSPRDLALVTSPHLYAVTLTGSAFSARTSDYIFEAIAEIMARACPAVKEVQVRQSRTTNTPQARLRKPYPGLRLDGEASQVMRDLCAKAEITWLSLGHRRTLQEWQKHTNFDALQTLELRGAVSSADLDWAARFARFPSLSTLHLSSPSGNESSTTTFLESLPSLKDLSVFHAVDDSMISVIIKSHGANLERLSLPNLLCTADMIRDFMDGCPYLEHLGIAVQRTQGHFTEVALYTELGAYPQLRSLCLELDCSIDASVELIGAGPFYGYKQEDIQRSLVNCAIDSTLAAEIFYGIAKAKSPGVPHIRSMELNVINAGFVNTNMQPQRFYQHFNRRWMCSFDPRDDRRGKVLAEEHKESRDSREHREDNCEELLELGGVAAAFRAMWSEGATGDWRDDWKSFPLHAWWYGGNHWMPAS